jgi:hypothetical protein
MTDPSSSQVRLSTGLPETVLPAESAQILQRLAEASALPEGTDRRNAIAEVVADTPRSLEAWAALGDASSDVISRYSAYRVGYHRGLDALRAHGWRGSGYVRRSHESNRAFLRCLAGLSAAAAEIGEQDEAERCQLFLMQLDPQ